MSILLPQSKHWLASNWISLGFFKDALAIAGAESFWGEKFALCLRDDDETVVAEGASIADLKELHRITKAVHKKNKREKGRRSNMPLYLPFYLEKLEELLAILDDLLEEHGDIS